MIVYNWSMNYDQWICNRKKGIERVNSENYPGLVIHYLRFITKSFRKYLMINSNMIINLGKKKKYFIS